MKKNSFKTAVVMTIMTLPLALYLIGVNPLSSAESTSQLEFIRSEVDDTVGSDTIDTDHIDDKSKETEKSIAEESITIDIAGEIVSPGVYTLDAGSRIIDAIEIAGGLTDNADVRFINRAEIIYDGSKIYIPSKEEPSSSGYAMNFASADRSAVTSGSNQLININNASSEELQKIPGVGPSTAEKIIAYRTTYGKFKHIEDLINISGIGNKTLEKMKGYITVR